MVKKTANFTGLPLILFHKSWFTAFSSYIDIVHYIESASYTLDLWTYKLLLLHEPNESLR